jgi:hypothetical protein
MSEERIIKIHVVKRQFETGLDGEERRYEPLYILHVIEFR